MINCVMKTMTSLDSKLLSEVIRRKVFTAAQNGTLKKATAKLSRKYPDYSEYIKDLYKFNEVGLDLEKMDIAARAFQENHRAEAKWLASCKKGGKLFANV